MKTVADGRLARGEERRRRLIEAALVILGREGPAGLTHRAVAEEAGVALASISYHFAGIDDLLEQVIERSNEEFLAAVHAWPGRGGPSALAKLLAQEVNVNRQLVLAQYEVYLHVGRAGRPADFPVLAWLDVLCDVHAPELDSAGRRALSATIEGIALHAVLSGEPADAGLIEQTLLRAWPGKRG